MDILSIGNSFSQDAQTYLWRIAHHDKQEMRTVNLMIGGCSLERHFRNIKGDKKEYILQHNGYSTDFVTSIKTALLSGSWDYVTLQQASHLSYKMDSYMPYLKVLADSIREYAPKAKILIHQTWGYATGSERLAQRGFSTMEEMSRAVFSCYETAAEYIHADGILPDGEAMLRLATESGKSVHRDGFHAGYGAPRYMMGCLWYHMLTGNPISTDFDDFDVPTEPEFAALARKIASELAEERDFRNPK